MNREVRREGYGGRGGRGARGVWVGREGREGGGKGEGEEEGEGVRGGRYKFIFTVLLFLFDVIVSNTPVHVNFIPKCC